VGKGVFAVPTIFCTQLVGTLRLPTLR